MVRIFSPKCILDIGCNSGALVKAFADLKVEAYGVDIAEDALSAAPLDIKKLLYKVNIIEDALPFQSEKFNLITAINIVEHLPDYGCFISEIKRTLKIGGFAYISAPSKLEDLLLYREGILRGQNHEEKLAHCNVRSKRYLIKSFRACHLEYVGDLPKEEYKKFVVSVAPQSKIKRMMVKIYSNSIFPDYRFNLIFRKA